MLRTLLVVLAALAAMQTAAAFRVMEQPETGFELALADVRLPNGPTGSVVFKTCDTCTLLTRQLTSETQYLVDNRSVGYADFVAVSAEVLASVPRGQPVLVALFVDKATEHVTRITLHRPAAPVSGDR